MDVSSTFSSFSVGNLSEAKEFYGQTLGLATKDQEMGLDIDLPDGGHVFVYEKADHQPAGFTVLNFIVPDIDAAHDALSQKGITFDSYDLGNGAEQDDKGILRGLAANMGPDIVWFKDPAGNVLSVIQNQ